jgi:TetR/AcrR family transcriptional regulator, transcriptional repressor for nem operon
VAKAQLTRQFIIERTAPLFNKKGFDATSLTDLTEATGLTKGAIYGNFSDKEEIALEAFRYSILKVRKMVRAKLGIVKTYKAQLQSLLDFYAEYVFAPPVDGGCPLLNSAVESDDHHTSMRRLVASELTHTIDFIASLLDKGVKAGEFRKKIEARQLAFVFFCSVEGALMFSRATRSRAPMDIVVSHCRNLLDQITKK